jgi:hypothetical protein
LEATATTLEPTTAAALEAAAATLEPTTAAALESAAATLETGSPSSTATSASTVAAAAAAAALVRWGTTTHAHAAHAAGVSPEPLQALAVVISTFATEEEGKLRVAALALANRRLHVGVGLRDILRKLLDAGAEVRVSWRGHATRCRRQLLTPTATGDRRGIWCDGPG